MECVCNKKTGLKGWFEECFSTLQKVGKAFMFPIALLPFAGLLLGIGAAFTNHQMISAYGLGSFLGDGTFLNAVLMIMKNTGEIVFANLPILFAVGLAVGLAK